MKKIGLLSDTHGFVHQQIPELFSPCDEIWHAGDLGEISVARQLQEIKPFKAVHGNIDGIEIRHEFPLMQRFMCEEVDVLMTHIGGYPGKYERAVRDIMIKNPPKLFISGHSHILKIMNDKKYHCLHLNPGAAGQQGFHQVITMLRFVIDGPTIKDMEVIELKKR